MALEPRQRQAEGLQTAANHFTPSDHPGTFGIRSFISVVTRRPGGTHTGASVVHTLPQQLNKFHLIYNLVGKQNQTIDFTNRKSGFKGLNS